MIHYGEWLKDVRFTDNLDGGGRLVAPVFEAALRGRSFKRCLEWCAGPAWIGLWLLENGIIDELVASDINPAAVEAVNETARASGANVTALVSDRLQGIEGKFDLIVGNPPSYCNIQESHHYGFLRGDIRPMDREWAIHRDFYLTARDYLNEGAEIWTVEVEPFRKDVYLEGKLYDLRNNVPIADFADMMAAGGLRLEKICPFNLGPIQMALLKTRAL